MSQQNLSIVSNVIAQLGWNEAHEIPIADEKNQKLILQLDLLQRRLHQKTLILENERGKVQQIREHMKNVKQETAYTAALCELRTKQTEDEEHQRKLAEREQGRLRQEFGRIEKLREEIGEKKSRLEDLAYRSRSELEKLTNNTGGSKEALDNWLKTVETRNEDMLIMKRYIKEDDSKLKGLDLELQQLTTKLREKKSVLDTCYTKTQSSQLGLDGISEETRAAYTERDMLIAQWENVINQMRQRDNELRALADRLNDTRMQVGESEATIRERQDFLKTQQDSTAEAQRRLNEAVSAIGKSRMELNERELRKKNFRGELEALKRTVDKVASDLEYARTQISQLKKDKTKKTENLQQVHQLVQTLRERYEYIAESKLTAEQLTNEAETDLAAAEANHERMMRQLNRLRDDRFKSVQQYERLCKESKTLDQHYQGLKASLRMSKSRLAKLDAQLLRHQEMIYKEDFSIQQLERRISRLEGERTDEDSNLLEETVRRLTDDLEERSKMASLLNNQLSNLRRDVHRKKREAQALSEKSDTLESQLQGNGLEVEIALKQKTKMDTVRQRLLVEQNLMRLEVRRLFQIYQRRSDSVYTMRNSREELELAIKDRSQQINLHQAMLISQIRISTEENSQLKVEIQARKSRIDKLIKRFEILNSLMAPPEGEEERTQTYYIIKAAQDKETLQRKGDQLDAETRQAEQELIALENTLAVMNGCNSVYRLGKSKLSEDSEELRMERDLKEQISVLSIKLRYDGIHLNELKETEATMLETRRRLDTDLEVYNQQKNELSIELNKKTRELNNQNERRDRAERRWDRVQSAVASMPTMTTEQRGQIYNDIKVRMIKELIDHVTRELLARIKSDGSMVEQAHAMLSASGVPFTTLGQSRQMSRVSISPLGGSTSSSTSLSGSGATSHVSSARSTLEDGDQSAHQSTDSHKQATQVPKPISAVDLGQQTILPGETRLASGTETRRSTAGEKSSSSSGSTSSKK
ncbi:Coiled-coil domain-containing protein 39 [Paragonimus skrjabini miyazakii]|uniref:Coiled-coil domain-containing protein 39 n=1 Tax=Paragonimus skrjabini miyazakii TaxID=59628 RepID=A0A8S9YLX0_9TREM|nr:Coiled-coil domain-containing protein 39 [Paragonimus skrjabini miyazakii]